MATCVGSTNNAPALYNMWCSYIGDEVSEWDVRHVMNDF